MGGGVGGRKVAVVVGDADAAPLADVDGAAEGESEGGGVVEGRSVGRSLGVGVRRLPDVLPDRGSGSSRLPKPLPPVGSTLTSPATTQPSIANAVKATAQATRQSLVSASLLLVSLGFNHWTTNGRPSCRPFHMFRTLR